MTAAIKNVLCVQFSTHKIGYIFPAPVVVTPDGCASLTTGFLNASLQRYPIGAAVADSRPDANRLNQHPDIKQHHVTEAFSLVSKVMPMLLTVIHQHTCRAKFFEIAQRVAIGDVVLVGNRAFKIGNEEDVQIVGARNLSQVTVSLVLVQMGKMQMGVSAIPALS